MLPFNVRETFWGLNHLRLKACRGIFKMQPDAFLERFTNKGFLIEICLDEQKNQILCSRCGFVMMRASLEGAWPMELCSAMPILDLTNPAFRDWLTSLSASPATLARADGGAILQD